MPEDSVLFRSDSPEYRSEFVGETLTELTSENFMKKDVLKLAGFFSSLSLLPQCCFYTPPKKSCTDKMFFTVYFTLSEKIVHLHPKIENL